MSFVAAYLFPGFKEALQTISVLPSKAYENQVSSQTGELGRIYVQHNYT